jgi:copper chaperone NosL
MKKIIFLLLLFSSCTTEPQPIVAGKDECHFCKMTVVDSRFATELITDKGKVFKFDDIICMSKFIKAGKVDENKMSRILLTDFSDNSLIDAETAFILESNELHSPMGGNAAAFLLKDEAHNMQKEKGGEIIEWKTLFAKLN